MVVERTVDGVLRWCVVHGHPQKPGSTTDKPQGAIIKCWPHTPGGYEKALAMHRAIIAAQEGRREIPQVALRAWPPSCEMVFAGKATHYLSANRYKRHLDEPVLVCSGSSGKAFGVALFGDPEPVKTLDAVSASIHKHGVDLETVKTQWPTARQWWAYPVTLIEAFKEPLEFAAASNGGAWLQNPVLRQKSEQTPSTLCFYHSDLDGIAAAAIVKKAHPDAELLPINYGQEFPYEKLAGRDIAYMVDFTVQPFDEMAKIKKALDETGAKFVWIDHHKTAIDAAAKVGFDTEGVRSCDAAGCELTWRYLYPNEPMPAAVKFAGRYDVWDHSDHKTLPIHYAMESMEEANNPYSEWWTEQLDGGEYAETPEMDALLSDGAAIMRWYNQFNAGRMKAHSFLLEFDGLNCVAAVTGMPGSLQFDSVKGDNDAAMAISFSPGGWNVSLYGLKPGIDVSKVCANHGGGGHPGAAGFQAADLPFELPTKRDQEEKSADGKETSDAVTWNAIIVKSVPDKRLVTSIVLKPEQTDAQGTIISADVIRETAHDFFDRLAAGQTKGIGYMHREFGRNLKLVESYIAPELTSIEGHTIPKGAWVVTVKVLDDEIWKRVLAGEIKGFSIGGSARVSRV